MTTMRARLTAVTGLVAASLVLAACGGSGRGDPDPGEKADAK